jgi:hypothetical protein
MSMATCSTCGDTIRYNTGMRRNGKPMTHATKGWYHFPRGEKRDHLPTPADGRSGDADVARETAVSDQLRAQVRDHLQSGFDHLHAEATVNDIFRDRRGSE